MKTLSTSKPPFWIVDFGVKIKIVANSYYSFIERLEDIPLHLGESTELIIILDQKHFDEYQPLSIKNYKLILVCDGKHRPPNELFQEASYCVTRNDDQLILAILSPYLFQVNNKVAKVPRQLHLICDDKGGIIYYDKNIFNFFNLTASHKLKNFSEIPIKYRFGELKSFEPIEGLLKLKKIDTWLNLRSTKHVEVFSVFVSKTRKLAGGQYYQAFNFNLWPEKSQLEENYKANINAFTSLLEESFDAILISDTSRIIKYASPGITRLAGYSPEELIGLDTAIFTLPEDAITSDPQIDSVRKSQKEKVSIQHRIRHKNGSYIWVEAIIADRRNTPGINGIVSSVRNIDAEKRSRIALEEWTLRFELASRATKDVIWDLNLKTGGITWGENIEDVFGWKPHEIDTIDNWMSKIPKNSHPIINQSFDSLLNGVDDFWSCHYDFKLKDGKLAKIEDRGYALRDREGKVSRLIGAMHDNTNAKNYENKLSKGEEKFRRLFEESLIGVSLIRLDDFLCLDCNQALLNILGYHREELLKMSLLELIPSEEKEFFFQEVDKLKKSAGAISFQLDFIRKDQSIIKVALSSFTIKEENNKTSAWMHILDLSPIIESSAALKVAENRFKNYIEKSSDIFATLNADSFYEYVSPNITKLLGYLPSEVIGLNNFDLIHHDDHKAVKAAYAEAGGEIGKVTRSIFRALHKNGSTLWVEANGKIENTDQGLKAFINIRDIEKEHRNEEELIRLSLVANKTENAVIITSKKLNAVWVNKSFENLTGYPLIELLNREITHMLFSEKVASSLDAEIAKGEVLKLERKGSHKSGKTFWMELSITPVINTEGLLQNYIFIALDISDRKKQQKQIQQNLKLISEQNERLKSFAHISSHSFLAHCQNIESLAKELKASGNSLIQNELVQVLNETTQSLSASLEGFQSILKTNRPQTQELEVLNIAEFVEKAKKLLANKLILKLASIEYQGDPQFTIRYFPAYLEDAFYTIFAQSLQESKAKVIDLIISTRIKGNFKVIELLLPISLKKKKKDTVVDPSTLLFSFPESIELIKNQLNKHGAKLKLKALDNFGMLLSLYFKDSD